MNFSFLNRAIQLILKTPWEENPGYKQSKIALPWDEGGRNLTRGEKEEIAMYRKQERFTNHYEELEEKWRRKFVTLRNESKQDVYKTINDQWLPFAHELYVSH